MQALQRNSKALNVTAVTSSLQKYQLNYGALRLQLVLGQEPLPQVTEALSHLYSDRAGLLLRLSCICSDPTDLYTVSHAPCK